MQCRFRKSDGVIAGMFELKKSSVFRVMISSAKFCVAHSSCKQSSKSEKSFLSKACRTFS